MHASTVNERLFTADPDRLVVVVVMKAMAGVELPQRVSRGPQVKRANLAEGPVTLRRDSREVFLASRALGPVVARKSGASLEQRGLCR